MFSDRHFLSFKGLKHYSPGVGWTQLDDSQERIMNQKSHDGFSCGAESEKYEKFIGNQYYSENVLFDPLMKDLLDRICHDFSDDLSIVWRNIVDEIDLLEQSVDAKRNLLEQITALDQEAIALQKTIINRLSEAQELASRQLSVAGLRAKISSVAESRLLVKLERLVFVKGG